MCGRYGLINKKRVIDQFHLSLDRTVSGDPGGNAKPTQQLPVITADERDVLQSMRWGLIPFWAKPDAKLPLMINARAETVQEKPAYRDAFKKRRCLVPANGYYEWLKEPGQKKGGIPQWFEVASGELMVFAGLWENWITESGEATRSFTIITCEAPAAIAHIHDRMPVILPASHVDEWLFGPSPSFLQNLLQPYPVEEMVIVSGKEPS